jgi:SAM-dependent methyltransferase
MVRSEERAAAREALQPYIERAEAFEGWAFPQIRTRLLEPGPPWDYEAIVGEHAREAGSVVDMGTGGGEFVARLREELPARLVATEEWHVNAPVAHARLTPLDVDVVWCSSSRLPFADESFDLVMNRHEELSPTGVACVLAPGGIVVTQQVGNDNWRELRRFFPRTTDFGDLRAEYAAGFEAAGLTLRRNERHDYRVAYEGLGDLVYMLLVTPWTIPEFDVDRDLDALLDLKDECSTADGLVLTWSRFLLVAEKPG